MDKRIEELMERIENHERRLKLIERAMSPREAGRKMMARTAGSSVIEEFKSLDSSEFEYVFRLAGLPLFLAVLDIAKEKLGIDGLTPPEISAICREKIRISKGTDRTAVSHALSSAKAKVDRIDNPRGKGFAYRIMREGEDFLQKELKRTSPNK